VARIATTSLQPRGGPLSGTPSRGAARLLGIQDISSTTARCASAPMASG